ncbi:helix-turn-helix domain-containing protein [Sinorhizobium alkalisoli]|uniref:AraC family transcriptional regulator n=1 Tax=Sinorhizobium alkalisoli TaxID=1752398 RepID=A0A1E3VF83_9HYPH|nr:helix-turn-helix domain-containing protein [Sinorhizobium alkalisoli]ODR92097.1 AraC family transcriptional regulator [Sinorhizobium alkalisoli]
MKRPVPTYELYGEESGERPEFWLHCETIPSRSSLHHWEIGLHRHENFFQILYIAGGSGDATFGGRSEAILPPAIVTVPAGASHGFRFSRDVDGFVFTVLASHLPASGGRSRLGAWLAAPRLTPLGDGEDGRYIADTLKRLAAEWEGRRSHRTVLLDSYLMTVLTLTERLAQAPPNEKGLGETNNERRMELFDALLQQHYLTHQPAAFYARELSLSPTHLNRITRAMTGKSVQEIIAARLLTAARRELVFTRASVQEISFRLGFSDPAYFSRFFVRHNGMTPRAWRIAERLRLGA